MTVAPTAQQNMRAQQNHENIEERGLPKGEFSGEVKPKASFERSKNTYMQIWGERAFQMPDQQVQSDMNRGTILRKDKQSFLLK